MWAHKMTKYVNFQKETREEALFLDHTLFKIQITEAWRCYEYTYHNLKTSRNEYRFGAANEHVSKEGNEDGENVTGAHVVRNLVGWIGYIKVHHLSQICHQVRCQCNCRHVLETECGCTNTQRPQWPKTTILATR